MDKIIFMQVVTKMVPIRTWYNPEVWQYGGLKVKQEVKEEGGPSSAKRLKRENP